MTRYRATIMADKFPLTFDLEASSWHTAAKRAASRFEERFKGSRSSQLTIKLIKES